MKAQVAAVTVALAMTVMFVAHAAGGETTEVIVSYAIAPTEPLPVGLEAVAIIDAAVEANEAGADERERKWSALAADMVESMLFDGGQQFDPPLYVTDRRNMKLVLDEHDLRAAGVVDSKTAHRMGKLLAVQGLVFSRISILIDTDTTTRRSIDWGRMLAGAMREARERKQQRRQEEDDKRRVKKPRRPLRPPWKRKEKPESDSAGDRPRPRLPKFHAKEIEEVSRHLTVQCSFSLVDAVSGRTVIRHSPPPYRKADRAAPRFAFGHLTGRSDLNPVDHFIGELVERAAQEFAALIVPVETEYRVTLTGKGDDGEAAVRALRGDDYETALVCFRRAYREDRDKHEYLFAMGVTCELMSRPEEALQYYRQALAAEDVDQDELAVYRRAKARLTEHIGRIVPAGQPPSPSAVNASPVTESDTN